MTVEHHAYMRLALDLARQALGAGEFPVGCILVSQGRVVASGKRDGTRKAVPSELDHAEIIALRQWEADGKPGYGGVIAAYSTLEPCLMCYGALLINGINTIVYAYEDAMGGGCACDVAQLPPLYAQSDITLVAGVCRSQSLELFKVFFSDPSLGYWRDSRLAHYTLDQ